jgi:hypothetical protein
MRRRFGRSIAVVTLAALVLGARAMTSLATPTSTYAVASASPPSPACTVTLDSTYWYFDPCIDLTQPLPDDVVQALAEIDAERASPAPSPTDVVTPGPSPSPFPTDTSTPSPFPTDTSTPSPFPTGTSTPTPFPTGTSTPTPFPTGTSTPTPFPTGTSTPTPFPTDTSTPTPSPTDTSCPPGDGSTLTAGDKANLTEAEKDNIPLSDPMDITKPRDITKIPCDKRVVLTATGDSMTSAHFQFGFGSFCENTAADLRNLIGNDALFSYASRYAALNPSVYKHYSLARTGFSTTQMLNATGKAEVDGCKTPWDRVASPVNLSVSVIKKAKVDGYAAYHVTTGGVNDTNWSEVIQGVTQCRAMEWAQANIKTLSKESSFAWNAIGGKAAIVPVGGACTLRIFSPTFFGVPLHTDAFIHIAVPKYDGAGLGAAITKNVTATVNAIVGAGVDKFVWMLYPDITLAQVDVANFALKYARLATTKLPDWAQGYLPPMIAPTLVVLIDPVHAVAAKKAITDLNAAIVLGIPNNARVKTAASPITLGTEFQTTAVGGSPHPSEAGHKTMAKTLDTTYKGI